MSGPTLVTTPYTNELGSPAVITPSFSPSAGEVIMVKAMSGFRFGSWSPPADSASALTFTQQVYSDAQLGTVVIWTAPVVTAPGPITISLSAPRAAVLCSLRWSGGLAPRSLRSGDRHGERQEHAAGLPDDHDGEGRVRSHLGAGQLGFQHPHRLRHQHGHARHRVQQRRSRARLPGRPVRWRPGLRRDRAEHADRVAVDFGRPGDPGSRAEGFRQLLRPDMRTP